MEQPSNPSPIEHPGFATHVNAVSNNNNSNQAVEHPHPPPPSHHPHVSPSLTPYPGPSYVREAFGGGATAVGNRSSSRERQSYSSSEVYPKESSYVSDSFGRDSFSADGVGVVNYSDETFSRVRDSLPPKIEGDGGHAHPVPVADGFHRGGGGGDVASLSGGGGGSGGAFPKGGDGGGSSSTDERSSKKTKRGGWWHDEEGGGVERPLSADHNDTNNINNNSSGSKEMETGADRKGIEIVGSFVVGSAGGIGAFRGVGVSSRGLNVAGAGGSAVAEMIDGCGDSTVGVGGVVVGVVRGVVGADGAEAVGIGGAGGGGGDIGDGGGGGGSCGGAVGVDGDLGDEGDAEGRDGDSRDKGDKDAIGKKKRAELWQDAEMDALVSAYRQIHMKLAVAGKKGKHVFKSANEKWKEVRNLLLPLGVDRQPKEIERKWSNLSTAFKQIADWNKKVGRPNYWDLDEVSKKEKTKAKELPATFRVQLYEAMAEFLGDRTAARRVRGWTQYEGTDRPPLLGGSGNGGSGGSEVTSGIVDIPLPMDKLSSLDVLQQQKRLRVVLVCTGSFNPPTYMHLRMFETARDALIGEGYDVLGGYLSPVNDSYGKKGLAPAEHRITLCQLATSDSSFIMVDPWEAKQVTYQRTLTVLGRVDHAVNSHGFANDEKVRVMLLCGGDLLESFTAPGVWIPEQIQSIFHDHGVVCIPRDGKDVRKLIFENDVLYEYRRNIVIVEEHVASDISSTKLRRNLGRGLSIKYLTGDSVIHYIKTHHLYDTPSL
ncbi:unnamed protein product [Calypogeia fissa]